MTKHQEKRIREAEEDLNDIIRRIRGMHGHYLSERTYESIRNLALAGQTIMVDCCKIMSGYDNENVGIDIQEILNH